MTTEFAKQPGPTPAEYAAKLEERLPDRKPRPLWPTVALCVLACAVALGWLAVCAYSDLFL